MKYEDRLKELRLTNIENRRKREFPIVDDTIEIPSIKSVALRNTLFTVSSREFIILFYSVHGIKP